MYVYMYIYALIVMAAQRNAKQISVSFRSRAWRRPQKARVCWLSFTSAIPRIAVFHFSF